MAELTAAKLIIPNGAAAAGEQAMQSVDIEATVAGALTAVGAVTAGTLTINSGSVTDSSGAIDFGDETLDTDGTITSGTITIGSGSITDSSGAIDFVNENLTTTGLATLGNIVTAGTLKQNAINQQLSGSKALTDATPTAFAEIAVGVGELVGGNIDYAIYVTDATPDYQSHVGSIGFAAVNKAGTVTCDIQETYLPSTAVKIVTAGTLTDAVTCTAGAGKITISMDADTSLAGATLTLKYMIGLLSMNVITAL